ncbi:MAG: DUF1365 domain-containing protein [Pseudooceanicola sp.]
MTHWPEHIVATTTHARRGGPEHAFRYGVDYVLIDPRATARPWLFSRNAFNLAAVNDRDHGGSPDKGRGVDWAVEIFAARGLKDVQVLLLTQPSFLGHAFNPVSFWLAMKGDALCAVIAEVNNTYGDRHSYVCAKPDLSPIGPDDQIAVEKQMYVSPFQEVGGGYAFNFKITPDRIAIRIDYRKDGSGLIATLAGRRTRLGNRGILAALFRRPLGTYRTVALIHWQALRLKLKGSMFRTRPAPPNHEVS